MRQRKEWHESHIRSAWPEHGNAGMPCHDLATIELTEKGWNQARRVATDWTEGPSMIVTSPFLRTSKRPPQRSSVSQTCRLRWPIEEFTYLPALPLERHANGRSSTASGTVWGGATRLIVMARGQRVRCTATPRRGCIGRLAALPSTGPIYVFSHGQFIQAVRAVVTESELGDLGKMLRFWRKGEPPAIGNAELVSFVYSDPRWQDPS